MFTCFERHLGDAIDSEGCANFYVCIMFYTLWATSGLHNWLRGIDKFNVCVVFYMLWATTGRQQSTPRDGQTSTFVLCFARFEQHLRDNIGSEGWAKFYLCIVFYTLWATSGRHNWFRGMGTNLCLYCVLHALTDIWATQLLSFTCSERHLGKTIDFEEWTKFYIRIVFYTLWATSGQHCWLRGIG